MTKAIHDQALANTQIGPTLKLFILIDALGWEYIKDRSFLNDLLPHRQPLRTVLGFSSGAIPTILTGELPSVTGHWNLLYYDPEGSPFWWLKYLGFLPDAFLNHRITTKLLKETGQHLLGLGPSFDCVVTPRLLPWFNWVEKKNIYEKGGISGAESIFDHLAQKRVPHRVYTYHRLSDAEIIEQARKDISAGAAEFFFLYLSEMDMFLHEHCLDGDAVSERVAWYDRQIRRVYESACRTGLPVTLCILSDHGMTPVTSHYDLMKDVESTQHRTPDEYLAVYDSTMARFWFFSAAARQNILAVLDAAPCGRILPNDELRKMGVWFEDHRFGEVIYLLKPGCMLAKSGFNGPQWMPSGMHGYHPTDRYSDGIFLSSNSAPHDVADVADVYRCMRAAL